MRLKLLSLLVLVISFASCSTAQNVTLSVKAPFVLQGNYIKPELIGTTNGVQKINLNLDELNLPVSTPVKALLAAKADTKVTTDLASKLAALTTKVGTIPSTNYAPNISTLTNNLNSLTSTVNQHNSTIEVIKTTTASLGNTVALLQTSIDGIKASKPSVDTTSSLVIKNLSDNVVNIQKTLTFTNSIVDSLKGVIYKIPEFNFTGFNGDGTKVIPLENNPELVTEATRLAMTSVRPGKVVTQTNTGTTPAGTYGYNAGTNSWKFLY